MYVNTGHFKSLPAGHNMFSTSLWSPFLVQEY